MLLSSRDMNDGRRSERAGDIFAATIDWLPSKTQSPINHLGQSFKQTKKKKKPQLFGDGAKSLLTFS